MLKDFYDETTEPIVKIEEFYGEQKHIVDRCLIIFSKAVEFRLSFGGITARRICNMNLAEAVDTPIQMIRNGCMLRRGFMKMDLKKGLLRI